MDFHSHINQTIIWQITIYHTWESDRVLRIQWYPDTSNPKVRTKFVKTKVKLEKNVKIWAVELGRNLWSLWMPVVASEHSTELWCLFWFCSIFSCNAICSLPKLCKSSFHHCCSVVVVGMAHKTSLIARVQSAVYGRENPSGFRWLSGIFFGSTAEGCCLATGGNLLVVCSRWYVAPSFAALPNLWYLFIRYSYQMIMSLATEATQYIIETVNPLCYSASRSFFGCGARSNGFLYSKVLIYPHIIFQGPLIFSDDLTVVQCYSRWCRCRIFVFFTIWCLLY